MQLLKFNIVQAEFFPPGYVVTAVFLRGFKFSPAVFLYGT